MTLAVIGLLVFGGAGLAAYAVLDMFFSEERQVKRVLDGLSAYEASQATEAEPMLLPFRERVLAPTLKAFGRIAHSLWPTEYRQRLRLRLHRAGDPGGWDVNAFLTVKALAPLVAGMVLGPLAVFLFVIGSRGWSLLSLLLVPLAFFVPDLWLSYRIGQREKAIRIALPDMLDMLTISVEAGLGFDAALGKLVKNSTGPLVDEFAKMLREVQAGMSRKDAFRNLSDRVQLPELGAFITAMVQADVFGVSISNVLRTQATEMRTRRRQHAEELAQKATVKLVFPLVLCILPATIIVVAGPAVISISRIFGLAGQ